MIRPSRFLFIALLAVVGGLALSMLYVVPAHGAVTGSPVPTAQQATDAGWSLVEQYGPIWGTALLLVGGLGSLLKANAKNHWLAQGRTLAILTGLGSVGAALLAWHFEGAPLAGVLVTALMAIKLVWSPVVVAGVPARAAGDVPSIVPPIVPPGSGTTIAALVLLVLGASTLHGCATAKAVHGAAKDAVIVCAKLNQAELRAAAVSIAGEAVGELIDTQGLDPGKLLAIAERPGVAVGGCALLDFLDELSKRRQVPVGDPTLTARISPAPDVVTVQATLEALRAAHGGVQWQTADGAVR